MDEQSTSDSIAVALASYLSAQAGHAVEIASLSRMSTGWESDVYAFDAPKWRKGGHVLRLYFGVNAGETALHEFSAMQLLGRAGYPVPQVDLVEPSTQPLGRAFMTMERIEGVALGRRWHDPDVGVRQRATECFCGSLARLHTLEWQLLPGAAHVPQFTITQQLDYWTSFGTRFGVESLPVAMRWLRTAADEIEPQPLGLVHWDFHHENILVDNNDRAWVIDWTQFQATDTRFDLAWTLILLASERDAATSDAVRAGYYAQRGWDGDAVEQEMRFFEAAASFKRVVSVLISLGSGADAVGMRPGAETVIASRLSRIALVYQRWLALTATPLADVETKLAAHL